VGKAVRVNVIDVSEGPIESRKYEILAESFNGLPRGDTVVLNPEHPMVKRALSERALRLMDEPAYENDAD
jgi:hypothetical protein